MKFPVFLMGFMASGKSSKGKRLARQLQVDFIDLDREIEKTEGCSVAELFAAKGEAYFRRKEAELLRNFSKGDELVIALGGGTVCYHDNLDFVLKIGTSIYLKRSEKLLLGRLRQNKINRPLIRDLNDEELKAFIRQKLSERSFFYEQADLTIDPDQLKFSELKEILSS